MSKAVWATKDVREMSDEELETAVDKVADRRMELVHEWYVRTTIREINNA